MFYIHAIILSFPRAIEVEAELEEYTRQDEAELEEYARQDEALPQYTGTDGWRILWSA